MKKSLRLFSSIKSKLTVSFVLLIITALLIMGGLVAFRVYQQTKLDYTTSVEQQIKLIDISIKHYIQNIANNTHMLANLPIMKEATDGIKSYVDLTGPEGMVPMEPLKGTDYEVEVFGILDSFQKSHISVKNASFAAQLNGGFVKSPPSARFDHYDARDREWYQSALAHEGEVYLSEMYTTSSNENVIYSVRTVEDDDNQIRGVISLDIDLKDLSDMIKELKFGATGYVVLADSKGNILAHPKEKQFVGQSVTQLGIAGLQNIETMGTSEFTETLANGIPYWIKVTPSEIPYFPLQYIVFIENKAFFVTASKLVFELVLIMVMLVCLAVSVAFILSSKIAIPILKLSKITESFSRGELGTRALIETSDEIGELAAQFNQMADRIQAAKNTLEKEVHERTYELSEANEALKHINQELLDTLDTLSSTQTQLIHSEKLAGLGTLVSGVAHEINTPVGIAITAVTHLNDERHLFELKYQSGGIKRQELEDYFELTKETIEIIMRNLDRAKILIYNFKQVSADQTSEVKRTINLKNYAESVILSLKPQLKQTQLTVDLQCPEDIFIYTYPGALAQMITNLVLNSIKHAYGPNAVGILRLSFESNNEEIKFEYSDDGIGMPSDVVDHVFEPFYTTKRESGGTGLGLHVVYNIITLQLHGKIKCDSTLAVGTRFVLCFPIDTKF